MSIEARGSYVISALLVENCYKIRGVPEKKSNGKAKGSTPEAQLDRCYQARVSRNALCDRFERRSRRLLEAGIRP